MTLMTLMTLMILLLLGLVSGCKPLLNAFSFYPMRIADDAPLPLHTGSEIIQERTIKTHDGISLQTLYLSSDKAQYIVLYLHGNGGHIYHRIPDLLRLQSEGVEVLGLSYRGYGKSEGSASEEGIYLDAEAAFAYVTDKLGFPAERVIILGRSIGTTVALKLASVHQSAGLILVTPLTSARDMAAEIGLGWLASLAGGAFDNRSRIIQIRVPLLVVHGTQDQLIPYWMGEEIYRLGNRPKWLLTIEGAGHNDISTRFAEPYWQGLSQFLQQQVLHQRGSE